MPDIAMCQDDECPARTICYRHEASGTKPHAYRQTYACFHHEDEFGCKQLMPKFERVVGRG